MSRFSGNRSINLLVLIVGLVGSAVASAGNEKSIGQAVVSADGIKAFAEARATSKIVSRLRRGDGVSIILKITTSAGEDWCRVVVQGRSGLTGYVECKDLIPISQTPSKNVSSVQQTGSPNLYGQTEPASGQRSDMTNTRVIDLSRMGLDDDIIIARIKHSTCNFQLADSDLVTLKKSGVSSKVIAAMLDAAGAVPTDAKPTSTASADGQPPEIGEKYVLRHPSIIARTTSADKTLDSYSCVQESGRPQQSPQNQPPSPYSTSSHDIDLWNLGAAYHGHDPQILFSPLAQGLKKSEFESTNEYNQRIQHLVPDNCRIYTFQVQQSEVRSYYDADSRSLNVFVRLSPAFKKRDVVDEICAKHRPASLCSFPRTYVDSYTLLLDTREATVGSYIGQNAYGAKASVASNVRSEYLIDFKNVGELPTMTWGNANEPGIRSVLTLFALAPDDPIFRVRLDFEPMMAKNMMNSLHVLAVCRLVPPYATSDTGAHGATLDEPYDLITSFNHLQARILGLWVYDVSTGRVLAKVWANKDAAPPSPKSE